MDHDPLQHDVGDVHYLDNAATTFPKPERVLQAMLHLCRTACVNPGRGTYDLAQVATATVRCCREQLNALFNGPDPNRVVFGYNATDALNLVIFGRLQRGGHVIATELEHNSVLRPIAHCVDDLGARATLVPFDGRGYVDPDDIRRALASDTRLVVVNHASNVLGTIQPLREIGAICRAAGVPLCVDAAQSAGVVPIDMQQLNVDIVAFTGHKSLLGPMGIGGLCVGRDVELAHTRAGGTGVKSGARRHLDKYPQRLEYGTLNMVGIAGLLGGLAYLAERGGAAVVQAEELKLAQPLWEALRGTDGVTLYCAESLQRHLPIFCFNVDGLDPGQVGARLDVEHDVACRTGLHCAPLVHRAIGTGEAGAVRFSLGPLTTRADVDAAIAAVAALAADARR